VKGENMGKDRKLDFGTYEEAAEWFDTHDMADYEDLMKPVQFSFDLRKNRDWVELENDIARNVRELAKRQKIPTRRLVNELLRERLASLQ
jgi:predicted DNA-binding ribbon-helix-helix protein